MLFNVTPEQEGVPGGQDELRYMLLGKPEEERVWTPEAILGLLRPFFPSETFRVFGCAGAFLCWPFRTAMAEAVLSINYEYGDFSDKTRYFQSEGMDCIVERDGATAVNAVLLQGYALANNTTLEELGRTVSLTVPVETSMNVLMTRIKDALGIVGDFGAYELNISGAARFRAALRHSIIALPDASTMFEQYVSVNYIGDMRFRGVTTQTDYTESGHFHGCALTSPTGGHLTHIGGGGVMTHITVTGYEPKPEQVFCQTY